MTESVPSMTFSYPPYRKEHSPLTTISPPSSTTTRPVKLAASSNEREFWPLHVKRPPGSTVRHEGVPDTEFLYVKTPTEFVPPTWTSPQTMK